MKTITFLLLLAFCSGCVAYGQKIDSTQWKNNHSDLLYWGDSIPFNGNIILGDLDRPINDTIKVIMMVSDTSIINAPVYIKRGYKVRDGNQHWAININYLYLDEKKRPIPKNIIIWLSHNANQ